MRQIIIDSNYALEDILRQRQSMPAPKKILKRQRLVNVLYYSFDKKLHKGQIVVDVSLVNDIEGAFDLIYKIKFPVQSVISIIDRRFMSNDDKSMSFNNSSGFNYRTISRTVKLSNHAFGRAIDINPFLNPFIGDFIQPEGATYDPSVPGTITKDGKIVNYFKKRGWTWGGVWIDRKDYMHFEKPL